MKILAKRGAVAPVIATLLMIAVAVAMSVIIFMWSQGFLSNTSNSVGGQQGSMNQGAQSAMAVESATAVATNTYVTVIVRNVGAVTETIGAVAIQPGASNTGLTTATTLSFSGTAPDCNLGKGQAAVIVIGTSGSIKLNGVSGGPGGTCTATGLTTALSALKSGDVINIKATTSVGTFGTTSITVP